MTVTGGRSAESRRSRRGPAQWLLGLLLILAIGASVAMIFSRDRSIVASLAVIAALWAAVIGAILVTKFRRQADSAEAKTRDLRVVYELQLEREITARKQYELGVEAQIRREVLAESSEELRALQEQVASLRASVEALVGELPDPRAAIEAERLRELARPTAVDESALSDGAAAERDFARTAPEPTSVPASPPNAPTEVIAVVDDSANRPRFVDETPTDEWATTAAPAQTAEPAPASPTPPPAAAPAAAAHHRQPDEESTASGGRHGRSSGSHATPTPDDPGPVDTPSPADPSPAAARDDEPAPDEAIADATPAWTTSAERPSGRDRHRAREVDAGAHSNGRSVSELMDSLRTAGGGRRRRRED
ncbi:DUF6779 domain-containing protein [Williamsia deligens]|uniref:DUF6779 domain-containing protein n=1 Tax=Williamsia deligens TaxID=321325 RepID=A0ABW3G3Z4_9NOCA|nr:DUF6779 domain-containing protein [Williamsia deligens]MCP2194316.1 hypothetical protein [Williamsia deligens]